jgi:hypothetical protein
MDHAEVRRHLEEAAVEPNGLERLLSSESREAVSVARHLDECAPCRAEMEALQRSSSTIRDVIRETPSRELRDRTLAHVARVGRARGVSADTPARRPGWQTAGWAAAAAAVFVGAVVWSTTDARLRQVDAAMAEQRATLAGMAIVTDWTLRLSADPDATGLRLEAPGGGAGAGTVVYSAARGELVMVADGLPDPGIDQEYRCWVERDGQRVPIGTMYRAGDLAYWAGEVDLIRGVGDDLVIGVSLVDAASGGVSGEVVLAAAS